MAVWSGGDRPAWFLVVIILLQITDNAHTALRESIPDSVRWVTSEFGVCPVKCGGGVQVRSVRCIRSDPQLGDSQGSEVPETECPTPSPPGTRSCNNHSCTEHWTKGEWSECSKTCGTGTQTREVKCESSSLQNEKYKVSEKQCPVRQPAKTRKCHITNCPDRKQSEKYSILSDNSTIIQLYRAKKITVDVGGQVNLLPGQTVFIKCQVKHYSKQLVYWLKGYRLVHFMGRVRSIPGGLHIGKADPATDAGEYTCTAGDLTATVTVQFIGEDEPWIQLYKKDVQISKLKHQKYSLNYKINGGYNKSAAMTTAGPQEPKQQRDLGQNSTHYLMYVTQEWTPCNATCGSSGQQMRNATCSHVAHAYVKIIQNSECSTVGLVKPETSKECLTENECAVWRPGPWSKCRPRCGTIGYQNRILNCVWASTGEHAWTACDMRTIPVSSKRCKTRPCPLECNDSSRYCSLISLLKLCRYHQFRQECCRTCHAQSVSTIKYVSRVTT